MTSYNISNRLVRNLGLGILVGIIAFISLVNLVQTSRMDKDLRTFESEYRLRLRQVDDLQGAFVKIQNNFATFVIQEQTDIKPLLSLVKGLLGKVEDLKGSLSNQSEIELSESFTKALKEYRVSMVAYSQELRVRRTGQAVRSWEATLLELEEKVQGVASQFKVLVYEDMNAVEARVLARSRRSRSLSLIFGVLGVLSGLVVALLLRWALANPIMKLIDLSRNIAEGDLSRDVGKTSDDEIGALSEAVGSMLQSLRRIVGGIKITARRVDEVAHDLEKHTAEVSRGAALQGEEIIKVSAAVKDVDVIAGEVGEQFDKLSEALSGSSSSTLELKSSIDEVSAFADQLASEVEKISSSLVEMDTTMSQNAEYLDSLSTSSEQTAATAQELAASSAEVGRFARDSRTLAEDVVGLARERGSSAVNELVEVSRKNRELVENYGSVIHSLGDKSASISEIADVIREVADQINLLAINAAIIAAQAGEHGKGFAVVAEEVGNLSVTTTQSVQKIEEMIKGVTKDVNAAVTMMAEVSKGADSSQAAADQTGTVLKDIEDISSQSAARAKEIAEAATEQMDRSQEILKVVTGNLEEVLQIKSAVDEQKRGSKLIVTSTDEIMDATRKLKQSTAEQVKESGIISQGVSETLNFSGKVKEAMEREKDATRNIVNSMMMIANVADGTGEAMKTLERVVHDLSVLADELGPEMAKFRLGDGDAAGFVHQQEPPGSPESEDA